MTPHQRDLAHNIFLEVVELPTTQSSGEYLNKRCADLPREVRALVESLLAADKAASDANFSQLRAPIADLVSDTVDSQAPLGAGCRIGTYRLLEKLGEGGMGIVFMAEQKNPVRRKVALKLIKPGMDSRQVIARFEAERQALAMMDHPNIAKVLDCGTTDQGLPYFVMELVKGIRITEYCDRKRLNVRERLRLFSQVCHATQHAHQKGIIHRDLKPSNVLVADYDNVPTPKVIDFGLAKALHHNLTDRTLFTQFGQVLGTYEYMSPEQAKLNQLDVDTRSDVYALGVLLYELLTGTTPFDAARLRNAAFDEMLRVIREEEPPTPSSKLSLSKNAAEWADQRGVKEPTRLVSMFRGELDAIAMKSLEKERANRYGTCAALAEDIKNYLDDQPVTAVRRSPTRTVFKFVRRNRMRLTVISLALITMLVLATSAVLTSIANDKAATKETSRAVARLVARSLSERLRKPVLSAVIAKEALNIALRDLPSAIPLALETLLNATVGINGIPLADADGRLMDDVDISADGSWVVALADNDPSDWTPEGDLLCWHLSQHDVDETPVVIPKVRNWQFDRNKNVLFVSKTNDQIEAWKLDLPEPQLLRTIGGFAGISSLAVDFESNRMAVATSSSIQLRDLERPNVSRTIRYPDNGTDKFWVGLSHGGKWLFGKRNGVRAREVYIWNLDSEQAVTTPKAIQHEHWIGHTVDNPDGTYLFTGSQDKFLRMWDLNAADPTANVHHEWSFEGRMHATGLALRDDSIAIGSGAFRVYSMVGERPELTHDLNGHGGFVNSIAFAKGAKQLVSGGTDGSVRLWHLRDPNPNRTQAVLLGHERPVTNVAISDDGSWAVSRDNAGVARLWCFSSSAPTPPMVLRTSPQSNHIFHHATMDISDDSRWLATAMPDSSLRLWDLQARSPSLAFKDLVGHQSGIHSIDISPDGEKLLSAGFDRDALLWDLRSDDPPIALPHPTKPNGKPYLKAKVTFSPDNRWAATACNDGIVRLWDLNSRDITTSVQELPGHSAGVFRIEFSQDSRWLASSCEKGEPGTVDHRVLVWDVQATNVRDNGCIVIDEHVEGQAVFNIHFIDDGKRLLTGGTTDDHLLLWDCESFATKELKHVNLGPYYSMKSAHSPNGRWLATTPPVLLYDRSKPEQPPSRFNLVARCISISQDSRWLAVGIHTGDTVLFDLHAKDVAGSRQTLQYHSASVRSVGFTNDGKWLVSCAEDGNSVLWPLGIERALDAANRAIGRSLSAQERQDYGLN